MIRMKQMILIKGFLIIIIFFSVVILASCKSQKEAAIEETKHISSEIEELDKAISDNIKLISKLNMHESRLRTIKINQKIYRIPVLIKGRDVYTSADELEIDNLADSLALEDLLESHHSGKGKFQSDDPSIWKNLLIERSKGASDHLSNVELPAIQKRINGIQKENIVLESRKRKLMESYRTLQDKTKDD